MQNQLTQSAASVAISMSAQASFNLQFPKSLSLSCQIPGNNITKYLVRFTLAALVRITFADQDC